MAEYIDRELAIEALSRGDGCGNVCRRAIERILAADVAPVRHGRWKPYHEADIGYDEYGVRCSNCKFEVEDHEVNFIMKYCPNCGAKMDGGMNDGH